MTHEIHDHWSPMNNDDSAVKVSRFWSLLNLGFFDRQVRGSRGAIQQSWFTARGSRAHPTTQGRHCWERGQDETTHRKLLSWYIPKYCDESPRVVLRWMLTKEVLICHFRMRRDTTSWSLSTGKPTLIKCLTTTPTWASSIH